MPAPTESDINLQESTIMRIARLSGVRAAAGLAMILALGFVAAPLVAQDDRVHGEFSRSLELSAKATVRLSNPNGSTTVLAGTKWDCDRKASESKVKRFEESHALVMSGNDIRIGAWDDPEMAHCTSIEYELRVPTGIAVQVEHRYGDVKIYDVTAPIDVHVEAGSIRVKDPGAEVAAQIGAGTISVTGSPREDWHLEAGIGGVEVRLPRDAAFELDAEARDGNIESDFPMSHQERGESALLRGPANGGGPRIRIQTDKAGIEILER
jgi:hypothetical protein